MTINILVVVVILSLLASLLLIQPVLGILVVVLVCRRLVG